MLKLVTAGRQVCIPILDEGRNDTTTRDAVSLARTQQNKNYNTVTTNAVILSMMAMP